MTRGRGNGAEPVPTPAAPEVSRAVASHATRAIAALFVRRDSIYKGMPGIDCYDEDRDARNWPGGCPVIAHPPCAQWGPLSPFAHDVPELKALGPAAVAFVQQWGGVLEHPFKS